MWKKSRPAGSTIGERLDKATNGLKEGAKTLGDGVKTLGDGLMTMGGGLGSLLAGGINITNTALLECAAGSYTFTSYADAYLEYDGMLANKLAPVTIGDLSASFVEVQPCTYVSNMSWLQAWDVQVNLTICDASVTSTITVYSKSYLIMTNVKISDKKRHTSTAVQLPVVLSNGFYTDATDVRLNYSQCDMFARILGSETNPTHSHLSIANNFETVTAGDYISTVVVKRDAIKLTTAPKTACPV